MKIWEELAASEARLKMMDRLTHFKVGFNDVENFNIGLIYNSKTLNYDNYAGKDDRKVVEAAMEFKRKDEIRNRRRWIGKKIKTRRIIETELKNSLNQKRKLMKYLNQKSIQKKKDLGDKYDKKIEHLRNKYQVDKDKEVDRVPTEMEEYAEISVFSEERFEGIEMEEIKVVKYGDVEMDDDEIEAMKLHPKMALPKKLEKGYLNLAMDIGYTKLRWQLQKEEEEGKKVAETENDKNREEENEIMEARTRQVFDCENRVYDERKQRVTDLKECTRIFLPKPLEVNQEAQIEMRREVHLRTSEEYREKECDEKGRQRRNLTLSEQRGLKKLEKRKNEGEIVVIMTDKSSKMCIMKRDDYEQLGEDHVGKDRVVDREEILEREKVLNQHSLSWCKMWRTGKDHGHEDRIRQSKITNSENRAELYLSYKDHKKVPGKPGP